MPEEHAILSASGAHRWLHCTPSARLEEMIPETTSEYAEEGRLAHTIAELKLRKQFLDPMGTRTYNKQLKELQENPLYRPEMLIHTDAYVEYVLGIVHGFAAKPHIDVELRLDFSDVVPDGFGTGDCIIIGDDTLFVIDFKYGKGPPAVSAEDNPQMMLYAVGALRRYSCLYEIKQVKMAIVQPRLDNISEKELPAEVLLTWANCIKPVAQKAFRGEGEYCAGDWCKFCRAKATCRARCDTMTALEAFGYAKPALIGNYEVGEILARAQMLKKWVEDLEDYALSSLLAGDTVPGWKAVEGRSNRAFENTDKAFEAMKAAGFDEAMLYERKPITLTAVETLLGKKKFIELLSSHVIKPPGKPTLAPETDNREAISNKITAAEAFAAETENGGT